MKYAQGLPVADQVINWLLLLRSGRATPQDYNDFLAWRAADPLHENAWQQLIGTLEGSTLGRLGDAYPIGYAAASLRRSPPPRPASRFTFARRFMTGSAALVGGRLRRLRRQCLLPLNNVAADAATATGERRRYVLSDGSQLLLDARSRVNLDFTPAYRQVRLLDGAVTVRPTRAAPSWSRPPRAPCARSAPVTWCVNRPSAPWWWCMSTKSRSRPCPAPMAPCGPAPARASTPCAWTRRAPN